MDIYMPMSTTEEHNELVSGLITSVGDLVRKRLIRILHEQRSLVHWGRRTEPESMRLVDVAALEDKDDFRDFVLPELEFVQPDFILFKNNPRIQDMNKVRTAGCPDLIIEIWSRGNDQLHREIRKKLYSTSSIVEHWYMSQNSNEVECYYGKDRLESKDLRRLLITRDGIEFDLRYLAIQ